MENMQLGAIIEMIVVLGINGKGVPVSTKIGHVGEGS